MEWVLYFAFGWWVVVAVLIMTAIAQAATKKPQIKSAPERLPSQNLPMHMKKF